MRDPRLTDEEIAGHLAAVPEWAREGGAMARTFAFGSFRRAMGFAAQVADAAEDADHHPDMDIRYRKVTLRLTTHDSGGLTARDFALASVCDKLAGEGAR